MKMDRLIGILSILLQQERVTAPYLAEKFGCPAGLSAGILRICAKQGSRW